MTGDAIKPISRTCKANLQYIGLKTAGISAINRDLLHGGKYSMQLDGSPYTGHVVLRVHQGGLRDRSLPVSIKELFRKEVMPLLTAAFSGLDKQYIGKIELHFNEGELAKFHLAP